MSLWSLYLLFAKMSALTFGGGYAMIPLFQNEIVVRHALMSGDEFANLVALAQVTPGPLGLNSATYVGMAQAGLPGAIVASLGVMTPSFIITMIAAVFLNKMAKSPIVASILSGVRPCVLGVIAAAVVFFADTSVFTASLSAFFCGGSFGVCWQGAFIFALALFVNWRWKLNILWTLFGSAALGWALMTNFDIL